MRRARRTAAEGICGVGIWSLRTTDYGNVYHEDYILASLYAWSPIVKQWLIGAPERLTRLHLAASKLAAASKSSQDSLPPPPLGAVTVSVADAAVVFGADGVVVSAPAAIVSL